MRLEALKLLQDFEKLARSGSFAQIALSGLLVSNWS